MHGNLQSEKITTPTVVEEEENDSAYLFVCAVNAGLHGPDVSAACRPESHKF